MKTNFSTLLILILSIMIKDKTFSQGCSDAGFCLVSGIKPGTFDTLTGDKNNLTIGGSLAKADHDISIIGNYLEYSRRITGKFSVHSKITSIRQDGNDISNFNLSDIYFTSNFLLNNYTKLIAGIKIPLSNANKIKDDYSLPMDYQSSLGTFDLILGLNFQVKKFQLAVGYEQALTNNKNEFLAENHPTWNVLNDFQSTNQYRRKGDVLLRVAYPYSPLNKLKITPAVLAIYHIANDEHNNAFNNTLEIEGSKGLTLNGNLFVDYELCPKHNVQLSAGVPFVVRDNRPDGLTRKFVLNLEYGFKF
ncbi:MAG: hypothetical protein V9E90_12225 [Saprospiraceae bacterium]